MKFTKWEFWKHDNCKDVFIYLPKNFDFTVDKQGNVTLPVRWCIQGIFRWWLAHSPFYKETITIKASELDNWKEYLPKP